MSQVLTAKIGEIQIARAPAKLQALALGSCVGVVLYDKNTKIAALAHVLLPTEMNSDQGANPGKFATTAIPEAIRMLETHGASRKNLIAKIAGGAKMFETNTASNNLDIGRRNIDSVKKILEGLGIRIVAEDVGENYGRTIIFDTETGMLTIRQVMNKKEYQI
ncbi:MAG: chemotaxis protein CheD [Methanobacteriota archaeon]|nr:MAG: chemotaxis protein CheD [Euryarchaeota archaeon]